MAVLSTPTKISLSGPDDWIEWFSALKAQGMSLDLWDVIDPISTTRKPLGGVGPPPEPLLSDYPKAYDRRPDEPRATRSATAGGTADEAPGQDDPLPHGAPDIYRATVTADLSTTARKRYMEDLSTYVTVKRLYNEKKKNENELVSWVQGTVSKALQKQCCSGDEDVSQWVLKLYNRFKITNSLRKQRADRAYRAHVDSPH
ncbi:gag protein [Colletotrichum musicola]|uniref:Gag protein n=1 Tax=Colletotrichum musicola TaxID=2175873 RepID=A0A8H6NMN6_9PEZI|nr:gag protein [Colletotrichum musicola]